MRTREYTNFADIEADLKILKLRREIDKETLKYRLQEAKTKVYPTNILGGMGNIVQKIAVAFIARKLAKKISR